MIQRSGLLWGVAFAALVAACGDNIKSEECGDGTKDDGAGHCVADGGGGTCGDGTTLNPDGTMCIPDSSACPAGLVIVDNKCQDPAAAHVDLEEQNPDNNDGGGQAGEIMLKPAGMGFVVHGCIKPDQADNFDIDDYVIQVAAPTLLDVTADGVGGAAAGFAVFPNDPNSTYTRFGANVTSTLSKRQIYLPTAGAYHFAALDSRTIIGIVQSGDALAAGNPDGSSCYYITLSVATPTTKALDADHENDGDFSGGKLTFYTAAAGALKTGYITGAVTTESANVSPAADVTAGSTVSDSTPSQLPASEADLFFGGVKAADTGLIVADFVVDLGTDPAPTYALTLDNRVAKPLPTDGTTVMDTSLDLNTATTLLEADNEFYFDVAAADEIDGLALGSTKSFEGAIFDADGNFVAGFDDADGHTSPSFKGLLRFPHAGRYYFLMDLGSVLDPTAFTLTSRLTAQTPAALVLDTGVTAQPVGNFNSTAFTFDSSTSKWDEITASSNAAGGGVQVTMLDPTKAYGRLDPLFDDNGDAIAPDAAALYTGSTTFGCSDPLLGCSFEFGTTAKTQGLIVEQAPVNGFKYLVHARTVAGAGTFNLTAAKATFTDLGAVTSTGLTKTGESNPATGTTRYRVQTKAFSAVTVTAKPKNAIAFKVTNLDLYEKEINSGSTAGVTNAVFTTTTPIGGVVDFTVTSVLAANYDLTIAVVEPAYTVTAGTDAFVEICAADGSSDVAGVVDNGVSDALDAPAGFKVFGATVTKVVVDGNGYLSFNPQYSDIEDPTADAFPDNTGDINVAPLWADLFDDGILNTVCMRTSGAKTTFEWNGFDGDFDAYSFQVVLNANASTIEYIYADNDTVVANNDFGFGATPGTGEFEVTALQSTDGKKAITVAQFSDYVQPATSILFTP